MAHTQQSRRDRFFAYVLAYSLGGVAEMRLIALSLNVECPSSFCITLFAR